MKFKLKEYSLYVDGSIEVDPSIVTSMLLRGVPVEKIFVTDVNDEIEKFNQFSSIKIGKKGEIKDISFEWTIPDHYKYMNIDEYRNIFIYINIFNIFLIKLAFKYIVKFSIYLLFG